APGAGLGRRAPGERRAGAGGRAHADDVDLPAEPRGPAGADHHPCGGPAAGAPLEDRPAPERRGALGAVKALLFSPLAFYGQIVLLLALALLFGALISGRAGTGPRRRAGRRLGPLLDRQRARAIAMGWSMRTWMSLRVGAVLAGLVAGVVVGTPVVILGGAAVG